MQAMYAGIAAIERGNIIEIGLSANDDTYSIDYAVRQLDMGSKSKEARAQLITDWIIETVQQYQNGHLWYALLQALISTCKAFIQV